MGRTVMRWFRKPMSASSNRFDPCILRILAEVNIGDRPQGKTFFVSPARFRSLRSALLSCLRPRLGKIVTSLPPSRSNLALLTQKNPSTREGYLCEPGAIRTRDLLLRKQLLYPAELRTHKPAEYILPHNG